MPGYRNEVGGHRIQRVPAGERRGRVHTSTVTVSVLDDERQVEDGLRDADLRHRWFSGTGPGGQRRNKVQCCLELTHVPTGISRIAHTASRETNAREARTELARAVAEAGRAAGHASRNAARSAQIGLGMRADKRRTYRFQDGRVTDHVTGRTMRTADLMAGRVDEMWP